VAARRRAFPIQAAEFVIPAKAGIQYAAASRIHFDVSGILDHPLSRMMTTENVLRIPNLNRQTHLLVLAA